MKKLLMLIFPAMILASCTKEPGEIRGVVTYLFNESQGYKPDVGALIYVTKINCDSVPLYYDGLSVCKYSRESLNLTVGSIDVYPYSSYFLINEIKSLNGTEIKNKISNLKKNIDECEKLISISPNDPAYKDLSDERKEILNKAEHIYSKFKNNDAYIKFINENETLIKNICNNNETLKAQVDASGNYAITQVTPGEYYVIIYSTVTTDKSLPNIPNIEKVHVDSKKTTIANARFK